MNSTQPITRFFLNSCIVILPLAISDMSTAQGRVLEEVVVTAQKREQSLQNVPAAVEAFSAEAIEEAGWEDLNRLQEAVPALTIGGESKARPYVTIRGVGTRKFNIGTDGSIGLFVDEIYNARFSSILSGIMDLERIEVLKGPQGTLYGRNTIGGAINVITRRPTNEFEGRVKLNVGNYDFYELTGTVSGPIVDNRLLGRLSASVSDVEGVYEDTVSGNDSNHEVNSARGSIVFRPDDFWDLTLIADYHDIDSDASLSDVEPGDPFGVVLVSPADPRVPAVVENGQKDPFSNAFSSPGFVDREELQLSLKAKRSGDNFEFTSISSYSDEDYSEARDFDATILTPWAHRIEQNSSQFSQEFRLSSVAGGWGNFDERLTWVVGAYYFYDDGEREDAFDSTADSILFPAFLDIEVDTNSFNLDLETTSYALYGQATYALSDRLNLTLGLRYSDDEKEFTSSASTLHPLPPVTESYSVSDTIEFDSTDPKVTIDYRVADEVMIYATYSTGYKSGGIQTVVGNPTDALDSYDEEELTNIELGIKSRWWDQRLQLNATLFNYDFDNQQVQSITLDNGAPIATTQNAAESEMDGAELEILALLGDSLTLDFKYAWLDASFDEFSSGEGDYSGNDMPGAPEHAVSAQLTHRTELDNGGALTLSALYSWKDDQYFDFANTDLALQKDYEVINLGAWWDLPDGRTRIRVYCDNCSDEEYMLNFTAWPSLFGGGLRNWDYGRRYGAEITYNF